MSRRKQRNGYGRSGLFEFTVDGDIGEVPDNPKCRMCPACKAQPGESCSRPARGGRRPLRSYHDARTLTPQETP